MAMFTTGFILISDFADFVIQHVTVKAFALIVMCAAIFKCIYLLIYINVFIGYNKCVLYCFNNLLLI